jgi:hypothetical protein
MVVRAVLICSLNPSAILRPHYVKHSNWEAQTRPTETRTQNPDTPDISASSASSASRLPRPATTCHNTEPRAPSPDTSPRHEPPSPRACRACRQSLSTRACRAAVFNSSLPVQGGALRAPRGDVSDAAACARAGRAASGRSPRGARLLPGRAATRARHTTSTPAPRRSVPGRQRTGGRRRYEEGS